MHLIGLNVKFGSELFCILPEQLILPHMAPGILWHWLDSCDLEVLEELLVAWSRQYPMLFGRPDINHIIEE